jgi:hypothetical protein
LPPSKELPLPSLLLEESEGSRVGRAIRNPPIGLFGRVQVSGGGPDDHFRRFIPAEGPAAAPSRPNNPIGGLRMARPTRDPSDSSRSNEGRGNSLEGGKVGEARRPVLFIEKL